MASSPLLSLSAELRNKIYDFTLETNRPYTLGKEEPGILQACKQTSDECIGFYISSSGGFQATQGDGDASALAKWLNRHDIKVLQQITNLQITLSSPHLCRIHQEDNIEHYLAWVKLCRALIDAKIPLGHVKLRGAIAARIKACIESSDNDPSILRFEQDWADERFKSVFVCAWNDAERRDAENHK